MASLPRASGKPAESTLGVFDMELGPIWRALMRNKTSYVLIALQIAVTMAIMVNAINIIQERSAQMSRSSGVDEENIFYLSSNIFDPEADFEAQMAADLDAIRNFPGVRNAIYSNSVPLSGGGWSEGVRLEPDPDLDSTGVAVFFADEHGIDTFGLNLIAGRNFDPAEVTWHDYETDAWPATTPIENALGKTVYVHQTKPVQIIGITERMQAAWNSWSGVERSMLVPEWRGRANVRYVIRAESGRRDEVMPQVEEMLATMTDNRIIRGVDTMEQTRRESYLLDSSMIRILTFIVIVLTAITGLGIVGLASFSVARRTKQIGTRRALGATRPAIMRYFMLENFLISTVGVAGGAVIAVAINMWMVDAFGLQRIAWYLIPAAMGTLWLVGQLAVYGPARRATMVPPALATRSV
jgi:putative ABC transport system permease protein